MAHFNVSIEGISGDMVGALADFIEREWGDFGMVQIEPIANGQVGAYPSIGAVEIAVPEPVPAAAFPTSSIEVVIPPEPVEPLDVDEVAPKRKR